MRAVQIVPNADEIARTRILLGKTQKDIAAEAGVPAATVCRIERGFVVTAPTANGMCRALNRSFDDLFTIKRPGTNNVEKGA